VAKLRQLVDESEAKRAPRSADEIALLVEEARAAWARQEPPDVAALKEQLRRMVGAPEPRAFPSADEYAAAFASWLADSDARLRAPAEEAGRTEPSERPMAN
jgi:hypothetical protein